MAETCRNEGWVKPFRNGRNVKIKAADWIRNILWVFEMGLVDINFRQK
jgi:hypothetical protein